MGSSMRVPWMQRYIFIYRWFFSLSAFSEEQVVIPSTRGNEWTFHFDLFVGWINGLDADVHVYVCVSVCLRERESFDEINISISFQRLVCPLLQRRRIIFVLCLLENWAFYLLYPYIPNWTHCTVYTDSVSCIHAGSQSPNRIESHFFVTHGF